MNKYFNEYNGLTITLLWWTLILYIIMYMYIYQLLSVDSSVPDCTPLAYCWLKVKILKIWTINTYSQQTVQGRWAFHVYTCQLTRVARCK